MQCSKKLYKITRKDIAYVKFILEGYEGYTIVRTLDPHEAIVLIYIAPGAETDIIDILNQLSQEIFIKPLPPALNDIYTEHLNDWN